MKIVVGLVAAAFLLPTIALPQDYSCTDSEILALEYSGSLTPPEELAGAIDADLQAIQDFDEFLASIRVRPTWEPSTLVAHLTPAAMQEFRAGTYHGFDDLNELYGPVEMWGFQLIDFVVIEFEPCYNPLGLIPIYISAPGVIDIDPSGIGGDGDDISILEIGRYLYRHGWGDCPAGCMYSHHWVITVENGVVQIIEEYGDPVATQSATWGDVKSTFR